MMAPPLVKSQPRDDKVKEYVMSQITPNHEKPEPGMPLKVPGGARILIVCENDSETMQLKTELLREGLIWQCAKSITEGCEAAKSGQFQVIVSTPQLQDGSWRRLIDVANHYDLSFEVILWAQNLDSSEWMKALNDGAFDVLDAACEQPNTVETTKSALWAAYLKGAGPNLTMTSPWKAA
jgi:DNA-binding NtrC family response regulator